MCDEYLLTDDENDFLYSDEALDIVVEAMRVRLAFTANSLSITGCAVAPALC